MDPYTHEALLQLSRAIQNDRQSLQDAFRTVGERLNNQDEAIVALSKQVEELTKSYAELVLINGGSNANQSNKS